MSNTFLQDTKNTFARFSIVAKLIAICVSFFLVFETFRLFSWSVGNTSFYEFIFRKASLPLYLAAIVYQPWSLISFMFMHDGLWHIVGNMLWLFWFGEIYMLYMNERRLLEVFIGGSLAGAALALLAYALIPPLKLVAPASYMVGASAGIEAIVFAATALNPNHEVRLFSFLRVEIKYIALLSFLTNYASITHGNAGGVIAHIGGAIFGFLFIKSLQNGTDWFAVFKNPFEKKMKPSNVFVNPEKNTSIKKVGDKEQAQIDEILDKINRSGYDSLSKEEKAFLFQYSNK